MREIYPDAASSDGGQYFFAVGFSIDVHLLPIFVAQRIFTHGVGLQVLSRISVEEFDQKVVGEQGQRME